MIEHPVTNQVIVAAPEWQKRKVVLEKLLAESRYLGYAWKNQTWGLIARTIFEHQFGSFPPSTYGPQMLKIYEQSTLKPLVFSLGELSSDVVSIDTRRCYTSLLMKNTDAFPCFVATDQVRPRYGKWKVGEYYVSKRFKLMNNSVEFPADWYPMPFVREIVDRKVIDISVVTHQHLASNKYEAEAFANFATLVHEKFPAESKNMINHIIGYWGKQVERKTQGCVTSEWDIACGMINDNLGTGITVHEVGNLCFIRKYTETRLSDGWLPIWRHIIAMSLINLDDMHKALVGPDTVVYGYNTDSIKLKNPLPFKEGKNPGDYQKEVKCGMRGNPFVCESDGWKPEELKWNDIPVEAIINQPCLVMGAGGSGKTYQLIAKSKKHDNRLILGYTKRTAENINLREAVGAVTLDYTFPDDKPIRQVIEKYSKITAVLVDEFSMIKPHHMSKLWKLKYRHDAEFTVFGDNNQTPPGADPKRPYNRINYEESALMYYMCGGNRCRLPYLGQRYDATTFDKLNVLLATNTIEWSDKKLHINPRMTLCTRGDTRARINRKRFGIESKDKTTYTVDGVEWYTDMPIIAYKNGKKHGVPDIVNSHHYTIADLKTVGKVVVKHTSGKLITVPNNKMTTLFRYGWCDTVARVQGGEINYPYNIVDLEHMTRNDLYTAVSRTTKWEYVGVDMNDSKEEYLPASYSFMCREIEPTVEIIDGIIYEKRDVNGKLFYIGRTKDFAAREEGHKRNPTNKDMAAQLALPGNDTQPVAQWKCTKRQIDALETEMIQAAIARGESLLNKKKMAKPEEKQVVVHTVVITKYPIVDNPTQCKLVIRYGQKSKEFKYKKSGIEAAMVKAKEFQAELISTMLL